MGVIWITILHALSFCFHRFFVVFEKAAGRLLISWDQIFKFFKLAAGATHHIQLCPSKCCPRKVGLIQRDVSFPAKIKQKKEEERVFLALSLPLVQPCLRFQLGAAINDPIESLVPEGQCWCETIGQK